MPWAGTAIRYPPLQFSLGSSCLEPALVENRLVQTDLGPDVLSRSSMLTGADLLLLRTCKSSISHDYMVLAARGRGFVQILAPTGPVVLAVRTTANHVAGGDSADNPAKRPCACALKSHGCGTDDAMKKVTAEPKVTKQIPKNTMSIANLQ